MSSVMRLVGWSPEGKRLDVWAEDTLSVGAAADNQLVVAADGVSRTHARLSREGDGYLIEDAGSRNGTRVNGALVTRAGIRHLDVVSFGDIDLVFLAGAAVPPAAERPVAKAQPAPAPVAAPAPVVAPAAVGATMYGSFSNDIGVVPSAVLDAAAPAGITGMRLSGDAGTFTLGLGRSVVGRAPEATVRIESRDVSRQHAVIVITAGGATAEDQGSTNGTTVNGVAAQGPQPLNTGDRLAFGKIELRVELL
jgi:pSer/pThr/pTyr-binding forkhead associated (FHA) protein